MKFLLDECITQPVAKALAAGGLKVVWAPDVVGQGASDERVYSYAATNHMPLITQDRGIAGRPAKQITVTGVRCGLFILRRPKTDSTRLKLIRILTIWEELQNCAATVQPPYIFECRATGMKLTRIR